MPKRRLLHAFSTFVLGGPQARFIRLAKHFGDEYHHVVLAMDGRYEAMEQLEGASYVERFDLPVSKGRNLNNLPKFLKTLKSVNPDTLFSYNFGAFEWAFATAITRTPHFHVEEGFGPQEADKRLWRRNALRWAGFKVSPAKLVVISETMREIAVKEWGVRRENIVAVTNGVDTERFVPRQKPRDKNLAFRLGTVAALRPEKCIDRLLVAVSKLEVSFLVECWIAGSGVELDALKRLAETLRITDRVKFVGHLVDPANFYQEIDAFVLSSDTEQVPLALLEAMSTGLPVVATDVGDVRQILGEENLAFIAMRDASSLADSIGKLLGDSGAMFALGRNNRSRILSYFSANIMNEGWSGLFET
jgi:glycosyltransferase involved in cell wall biosynthesis